MPEYDGLPGDDPREFLDVAAEKTERIYTENLGYLAENPYPGRGRGDTETRPIDGRRDRYRLHIARTYTTIYTVLEDENEVRVLESTDIDDAHKRHGFCVVHLRYLSLTWWACQWTAEPVSPAMFVPQLAAELDCPDTVRYRARTLAEQAEAKGVTSGVHPAGFAAACLYEALCAHRRQLPQTRIAETADVCVSTVRTHVQTVRELER